MREITEEVLLSLGFTLLSNYYKKDFNGDKIYLQKRVDFWWLNSKILNLSEIPILDVNTLTAILYMCKIPDLKLESLFFEELSLIEYLIKKDLKRQVKIGSGKEILEIVLT